MRIKDRLDDAQILWKNNRLDGAFLNILIAVASASRKKFPKDKFTDKDAFINFIKSFGGPRIKVEYRGECYEMEYIFYKWVRCELVHEGDIPIDIQFFPEENGDGFIVRAGGFPEYTLKLSKNWFWYFFKKVEEFLKSD